VAVVVAATTTKAVRKVVNEASENEGEVEQHKKYEESWNDEESPMETNIFEDINR
jgi:hypothetical protein